MTDVPDRDRMNGFFKWIGDHVSILVAAILATSVGLGLGGFVIRSAEENPGSPRFDPGGEIYDIYERADELFDPASQVVTAQFFVEAKDPETGDVLTREALLEFVRNADALEADSEARVHLTSTFDNDLDQPIDPVLSVAHAVDQLLPDGLVGADDADVKQALAELLGDESPGSALRATLSQLTTSSVEEVDGGSVTVWRSPAFQAIVAYQRESFEIDHPDSTDADLLEFEYAVEGESWLRDVQGTLRGDQRQISVLGLAIDGNLTDDEQSSAAAPFIFGAIVLIVLLVGALVRSYWASAVVAAGLSATFLAYNGIIVLAGLKDSILLTFIIPIAVLSFGVDFFVHGFGRCREEQTDGLGPTAAYPIGMTAVASAVMLAVSTSAAAFLSNASSDIESIRQFGIGAAIGLVLAYMFVGVVGPRVVLGIEERVGAPPLLHGPRLGAKLGFLAMSLVGGGTVTMSVVMVPIGAALLLVVFLPLAVFVPYKLVRRRNMRAEVSGRELDRRSRGVGHGLRSAGSAVHFLARWRVVTVPVTVVLAILGLYGFTQVEEEFSPSDFTASDTDLIRSLDTLGFHFGSSTGTSAYLYAEGDLTQPALLSAIDDVSDHVDAADVERTERGDAAFLARDFDGTPVAGNNAADVVRAALASPATVAEIEATTGVTLTVGPDGMPTSADQVLAIYEHTSDNGIADADGGLSWRPEDVQAAVHVAQGFQATRVGISIATVADLDLMVAARDALETASVELEEVSGELAWLGVSGPAVTQEDSLTAFTASMVLSLIIALVLCALIAWAFMRSLTYALVSVIPILLVVGWVYGFMYVFDYSINPVTATIAAIAVGVGVDFAMHFTMRFREEFVGEPSRFPALRRAGERTGGALVLSALTSMGGFFVMALAPMPVFADFGLLTAVMILFSLLVALFVLPSLLLLVTPARRGEERQRLLDALRDEHYDPHSRATSLGHEPAAH